MSKQISLQDATTFVTNSGYQLEAPATEDGLAEYIYRNQNLLPEREDGELIPNLDAVASAYLTSVGVDPSDYGI